VPLEHAGEAVVAVSQVGYRDHRPVVDVDEVCEARCDATGGIDAYSMGCDAEAEDPLRAIAAKYYHLPCSVMTENEGRRDSLRLLAGEYRPQCVVELIWQACLTYDVESHFVKKLVVDELGLPYLRIETDYSPSDTARISLRVQALFETAKAKSSPAS